MPVRSLPYVLAASAFLFLSAQAAGSETEATPPGTPAAAGQDVAAPAAKARALMTERRYREALDILRPLTERSTVDADVVFLRGVAALEAAQQPGVAGNERDALLDEAVASFRTLLIARPELVRVRLELARAFFVQREDSLAREHFERVLGGDLPPPVVANVQVFLAKIRARRRWRLYFSAALTPDNNIGSGSDEACIYISGLCFQRDVDELTSSGVGVLTRLGGEYHRPLGDRFRLRLGGDVSRREYAGSEFDETFLSGHLGPRWLAGPRTDVSVLGSVRRRLVAGSGDYDELGIRAEATRRLTTRVSANGQASWHDRRYRTSRRLDGPILDLSLGASWVVTPTVRMNGSLGYGRDRPGWERNRNTSRRVRVGAEAALPGGFSVGGSGQLRWADYDVGFLTPGRVPREDRIRTLSASVHHRRFALYGFSPKLVVTNEARTSNDQGLDYRRTHAELRFVRQF